MVGGAGLEADLSLPAQSAPLLKVFVCAHYLYTLVTPPLLSHHPIGHFQLLQAVLGQGLYV